MHSKRVSAALLIVGIVYTIGACARGVHRPAQPPPAGVTAELWSEPADLGTRDLFHGPGGRALVPPAVTYTFVARKTTGINPGYDVRDPEGRTWSVKLGEESQSEVTVSRILWAIGFHQAPTYYVEGWQMTGGDKRDQPAGRFRPDLPGHEVVADWSWYDNPFVGSRPFAALVAVNLLLKNWDLKTANNKVYLVTNADGRKERRYVVRDVGASLGKAKQPRILTWFPFMRYKQGSKNNLEDFEAQGFVKAVDGDSVDFDYQGLNRPLLDVVTPADLRWTCDLLDRLSEKQLLDAFRAGGYSPEQSSRYLRKIEDNISRARKLTASKAVTGARAGMSYDH